MSLKHGLLGLLRYGEMTGYELSGVFEASLRYFWRAQKSQIYRELKTMEEAGWVSSQLVIQTDKPNKRLYAITDAGEKELLSWLKQPLYSHEERLHSELLLQLFFSNALPKEENVGNIMGLRAYCLEAVQALSQNPEESIRHYGDEMEMGDAFESLYWRFTVEYGRRYYQMVADWADFMLDSLKETNSEDGDKRLE